jgi:TrmH family RNA methyltransferase
MVSKNQIKLITSLQQKKFRQKSQLFIAEGVKVIQELLQSNFVLEHLYVSEGIFLEIPSEKRTIVTENDLKKITCLSSPNNCLALFQIPTQKNQEISGLTIVLDDIRDPGNMGTIIRLCDWYGVNNIICSDQTVDIYNPKVVQATMGSIARVNVYYENLNTFLPTLDLPIYGTFMDGKNVYKEILPKNAILVLGNEANGISTEIEKLTTNKIAIPKFGTIQKAESLNVAMATAIFLSEFKRSAIEK